MAGLGEQEIQAKVVAGLLTPTPQVLFGGRLVLGRSPNLVSRLEPQEQSTYFPKVQSVTIIPGTSAEHKIGNLKLDIPQNWGAGVRGCLFKPSHKDPDSLEPSDVLASDPRGPSQTSKRPEN